MKLRLKDDPKEWRKAACFSALGLAILSTLLCWRRILPVAGWAAALVLLAGVTLSALRWPRWFRGYYRFSSRLAFCVSQFVGRAVLAVLFFLLVTPMGWVLRLLGKDLLRLKHPRNAVTYWSPSKESSSLDRLF